MEMLKFYTKNKKNCDHIGNHRLRICLVAKLREKMKMPKFGTENVLFGYLWDRILKNYFHI